MDDEENNNIDAIALAKVLKHIAKKRPRDRRPHEVRERAIQLMTERQANYQNLWDGRPLTVADFEVYT
jgi:hypothetical protein